MRKIQLSFTASTYFQQPIDFIVYLFILLKSLTGLLSFIRFNKLLRAVKMDYFDEFEFKTPRQQRAKKALADISESLEKLSQSGDLAGLKSRTLSEHSGYAVGTIFNYFRKFDDVFVYIYLARRKKALSNIADIINNHPPHHTLNVFLTNVLDAFIHELSRPNRKTLLFVMHQFVKRTKHPEMINVAADILIPLWIDAGMRDETDTFCRFSECELRLRFRAMQAVVRSPFFEDDIMAGTEGHRDIALNIFTRLFTVPKELTVNVSH